MIKPEGVKIWDKSYWFILSELEPFPEPKYKRLCDFYLNPQPVYDSRTWTNRSGLERRSIRYHRSRLGQSHYYRHTTAKIMKPCVVRSWCWCVHPLYSIIFACVGMHYPQLHNTVKKLRQENNHQASFVYLRLIDEYFLELGKRTCAILLTWVRTFCIDVCVDWTLLIVRM